MDRSHDTQGRQWRSHPVRAAALRTLAFVLPLVVSVIVGMVVGTLMPAPASTVGLVLWWAAVLGSSTLAVFAADRVTRRVLPLATLMRLSILFPDHAPSRLKVARRVSGSRAIAAELAHAGMASDRQEAAETILALVGALGDYDSRTRGHSERTQLFVTMLADELKLSTEDKGKLMWAALVHDIGKLKVPHEVLNKPAKPTEDEWALLRSHPHHGAEICEPLREWLGPWWLAIEQHHEKYDGSGYPHGLAGKDISYGARIVAVADSYEVMTAARPYKRPMAAEAARAELTACAGPHFDPEIVRAFLNISLGGVRRSAGPLAWLAQILMVRPGPLLGQVMGASAGAAGAAATVLALNMAPVVDPAEQITTAPSKPPVTTTATPAPTPPARPTPGPATPPPAADPAPFVLVDDVESTTEDTARLYDVLANDTLGGVVELADVTSPVRGASSMVGPYVLFTPDRDANGTQTFAYTVRDADGQLRTAQVTVDVSPVNDRPTAADDVRVVAEDALAAPLRLLGNDTDVDGDTLTVTSVTGATRGTVTRLGDDFAYTPDRDQHGPETLSYRISDGNGGTDSATVSLTVAAADDAPVARPDTVSMAEDSGTITLADLLTNDTDAENDPLTVTDVRGAAHGTIAEPTSGVFTYTPQPDFTGLETLGYTVSDGHGGTGSSTVLLTVTPVNDAPVATDGAVTAAEDSLDVPLLLLANDTDVDGDVLTATSVSPPVHGTVRQVAGSWTYTPDPSWNGVETLAYAISDGSGGTASADVEITITAVNDAPVAVADTTSMAEDSGPLTLTLTGNDTDVDGDTLTVTSVTGAAHGVIANPSAGVFTYDPDPNWSGPEALSYTISDGNGGTSTGGVDLTVTAVNDAPVATSDTLSVGEDSGPVTLDLLANDSDVENDTLTVTDVTGAANGSITSPGGAWTYTPAPDFSGTETLDYTVDDGNGGTDSGTMTVTVTPVPDPPVANDDTISLPEDSVDTPLDLLGNDVDVDGDTLTVTAVTGAVNGTLTEQSPGVWTYTPDADWNGTESLGYDVSDGNGGTDTATATLTVAAVNDAPVTGPDAHAITTVQTLTTTAADGVLSNDSDVDGDTMTVTGDDSLLIDINADGSFTYVGVLPTTEVVDYTVSDGQGGTAVGRLTITVTLLASSTVDLYLQPVDTVSMGSLTTSPPVGGIGDYDSDGSPGLTIDPSSMHDDETDTQKYQEWSYPVPAGGLTLNGPITMDLWTSLKDQADKDLDYAAWVYDCDASSACTLLASTVGVHVDQWSTTTTWEKRTVTVGSANSAVPAGHTIRVRLAFNHEDVWLPLDSAHPSALTYTR